MWHNFVHVSAAGGAVNRTIELLGESNYCYFPEGTYEMHTTTTSRSFPDEQQNDSADPLKAPKTRAEWMLNILWNMKGEYTFYIFAHLINY